MMQDPPDSSPADTTFRLLANPHRRQLLASLVAHDAASGGTPLPVDELVDGDDLELQLVHVHLPMLDAAGVVEWTPASDEVAPGPAFDDLQPLLELLDENPRSVPGGWP